MSICILQNFTSLGFFVVFVVCPVTAVLGFSFPFLYLEDPCSDSQSWSKALQTWLRDARALSQAGSLCPAPRNAHKMQAGFY